MNNPARQLPGAVELPDLVFDDDGVHPLIDEGEYIVKYLRHETSPYFGKRPRIFIHFEIIEGPHAGTKLFAGYNASELIGKPGRNGRFKLKRGHKLFDELCRIAGKQIKRPD